ncbi:MAG: Ppx/GppA family phosphatase [Burkholderiaceae bacterium]|jgi:exopolyphosphatase/guanosine-5'-triphosphate,3'-diphosphate pyrophosphatase|nr:Ppx/GppA family phosphatase [Burkholderiaceae bacterium]
MLATIDMGSNSFRLQIGEYRDNRIRVVTVAREPNRLAAGLDKKNMLSDGAIKNGLDALRRLRAILDAHPISAVRAVATNTLRIAVNSPGFLAQAEKVLGYPIEVISGEEEGRLVYLGVANLLADAAERRLVVDIGGGSTEMILGEGVQVKRADSFNIGTVKQSLSFFSDGVISASHFDLAFLSARSYFREISSHYGPHHWAAAYGSSGTIRSLAEIMVANQIGDGRLTYDNLNTLRKELIAFGKMGKVQLNGLRQERTASIIGGLTILTVLMQELNMPVMNTVASGLRMGLMWDLCLQSLSYDRREQSIAHFMTQYRIEKKRAVQTAEYACSLFDTLSPNSDFRRYVHWGALAHEAGLFVSPAQYHKHGAYLIQHADLAGFTMREQKYMAQIVRFQKDSVTRDILTERSDLLKAVLSLRLAILFRNAGVSDDIRLLRVHAKKRVDVTIPRAWTKQYPVLSFSLRQESGLWDEAGVHMQVHEE